MKSSSNLRRLLNYAKRRSTEILAKHKLKVLKWLADYERFQEHKSLVSFKIINMPP